MFIFFFKMQVNRKIRLNSTLGALMRAFLMASQLSLLGKCPIAHRTQERFLSGKMTPPMDDQFGLLDKRPLAHITLIGLLPGMNPPMTMQIIVLGECLAADFTLVGFLAGVNSHVFLEVCLLFEAARAGGTLEGSLACVDEKVLFVAAGGAVGLLAQLAYV
jgi:hypothetical protein